MALEYFEVIYEYKVVEVDGTAYGIQKQMNELAENGWRVVTITHAVHAAYNQYTLFLEKVKSRKKFVQV